MPFGMPSGSFRVPDKSVRLFSPAPRLGPQGMIQLAFPHAQALGSDLQQFIVVNELQALFQGLLPVDFVEAIVKGNPLHNIPLMNGDAIHVPSLDNGKVAVLGEVGSPDCIPYQPGLTLLQAISYVGGLKETNSWYVKVIRGGLKNPVVFTLDIIEIQKGRRMEFSLKPRDIVFVPRSFISEWNVIVRQILPTIQLLNGLAGPFGSPSNFLYR